MILKAADLARVLDTLEKIDQGLVEPRLPGPLGRFLRQYRDGRPKADATLHRHSIKRRADGAVSGESLGIIGIHVLSRLQASVLAFPLGEVADTLGISEELGGLAYLRMWLKSPIANAAYNALRLNSGLTLSGDFRWRPLSQVTTGEAFVSASESTVSWNRARCLKAVADDLIRPPHALEYILDYRIGPPGLKFFRTVCALKRGEGWQILPAFGPLRALPVIGSLRQCSKLGPDALAALLIYCEPWSQGWMIADSMQINAGDAIAHATTWVDFQREIEGIAFDGGLATGIHDNLCAIGLYPEHIGDPNLNRSLIPLARDLIRSVRGLD